METESEEKGKKKNSSIMFKIVLLSVQSIVILVFFISFLIKYFNK